MSKQDFFEGLRLRRATEEDARQIFFWRNLPEIIVLSTLQKTVTWDEHRAWYRRALQDQNTLSFIVMLNEVAIGQVRFSLAQPSYCEVSIYIVSAYTNRGLGTTALHLACQEAFAYWAGQIEQIAAFVREDNYRSRAAFEKCGFELTRHPELPPRTDHVIYSLIAPA